MCARLHGPQTPILSVSCFIFLLLHIYLPLALRPINIPVADITKKAGLELKHWTLVHLYFNDSPASDETTFMFDVPSSLLENLLQHTGNHPPHPLNTKLHLCTIYALIQLLPLRSSTVLTILFSYCHPPRSSTVLTTLFSYCHPPRSSTVLTILYSSSAHPFRSSTVLTILYSSSAHPFRSSTVLTILYSSSAHPFRSFTV